MSEWPLHPQVERYLDGEVPREALTPEQQREADAFDGFVRARTPGMREHAPAWLANRIMVSLPPAPTAPWHQRLVSFLVEPQRIRVRPMTLGLAAAVLAALLFLPRASQIAPPPGQPGPITQAATTNAAAVFVQFVFAAKDAQSVAVAGDFNSWQAEGISLRDADGDGIWTALIPLSPGQHKYMFIVNGKQWVTDPGADRYVDDGFGMRNAVITVSAPARSL
jgi:hypothetical protein